MIRAYFPLFSAMLIALSSLPTAVAADKPIPVSQAAQAMTAPAGFQVTLFAGEPDVVQPIAMTFDDRGRMWVVECRSYPNWVKTPTGPDRVLILEDTDGDGRFDQRKVFLDNGANLTGIAYGHGGIWLTATPNIIFVPDANHDDIPDGPPIVKLDGWDINAKHNVVNALRWGPDGWLWGCNGILSNSKVGKPGTADDKRVIINCGVWRYHPKREQFETVASGTTNPWGLDFDDYGEAFITNCVIDHLWHITPGGHYQRMFGQDVLANAYDLLPSAVDYQHWAGGHWTESRKGKNHSDAGGGHAHSGAAIYLGDQFPAEYRNSLFTCNIHGSRLNRDLLERTSSGYAGRRKPDFVFANDEWFRGIAVQQGPNGVYYSDWSDTGECHNYIVADRSNGRIYRTQYGKPTPWKGDLTKLSDMELAGLQLHRDEWFVRQSRRILQERFDAGKLDPKVTENLTEILQNHTDITRRLRALWTLHAIQGISMNQYVGLLEDHAEAIRVWALRLLTDVNTVDGEMLKKIVDRAGREKWGFVRLNLAATLQRLPIESRKPLAMALLAHAEDADDRAIPKMIWFGIEPIVASNQSDAIALLEVSKLPTVRTNITRRLLTLPGEPSPGLAPVLAFLARTEDVAVQKDIVLGMQLAYAGRRQVPMPPQWPNLSVKFVAHPDYHLRERSLELGVLFDDPRAIESLIRTVQSPKQGTAERDRSLSILLQRQKPELLVVLHGLLDDPAMRASAIRGLAAYNDNKTADLLISRYRTLNENERADTISTLASRPESALKLLDAVERQVIPRQDVSLVIVRQMQGYKQPSFASRFSRIWATVGAGSKERIERAAKYREQLTTDVIAKANLVNGRKIFAQNCATCHKLFDDGGLIGPELTGSQRAKLDYVLENVLDPNAIVPRDYQVSVIELDNGRILNGIIKVETDRTVQIQTSNELVTFPKSEIVAQTQSPISLMPEGLIEKLTLDEARDLIGYLASPSQVALPK